jgi:hypothetical protein
MFLFVIINNLMSLNRVAERASHSVNITARILLEHHNLVILERFGNCQAAVWNTENCRNMFCVNNAAQRNVDAKGSFLFCFTSCGLTYNIVIKSYIQKYNYNWIEPLSQLVRRTSREGRVNNGEPELKPGTYSYLYFYSMYILLEISFEFLNMTVFGGGKTTLKT